MLVGRNANKVNFAQTFFTKVQSIMGAESSSIKDEEDFVTRKEILFLVISNYFIDFGKVGSLGCNIRGGTDGDYLDLEVRVF